MGVCLKSGLAFFNWQLNNSSWKKSLSLNTQKDENVLERWETLFQRKHLILPAGEKEHFIWRQEHYRCRHTISLEIFWMNNKTITLTIISLPNIANISMTNNKRNSISKMGGSESSICRRHLWGTEKKIIFRQPLTTKDKKLSRE